MDATEELLRIDFDDLLGKLPQEEPNVPNASDEHTAKAYEDEDKVIVPILISICAIGFVMVIASIAFNFNIYCVSCLGPSLAPRLEFLQDFVVSLGLELCVGTFMLALIIYFIYRCDDERLKLARISWVTVVALFLIGLGFLLHAFYPHGSEELVQSVEEGNQFAVLTITQENGSQKYAVAFSNGSIVDIPVGSGGKAAFVEEPSVPEQDLFGDADVASSSEFWVRLKGLYLSTLLPLMVSAGVEMLGALVIFTVIENVKNAIKLQSNGN